MKQSKHGRNTPKLSVRQVRQLAAGVAAASILGLGTTVVNADSWGSHGHSEWGGSRGAMMAKGGMGQGSLGQGMMAMGGMGQGGMGQGMMAKGGMGHGMMGHGSGMLSGQFVEGRLAFLKAELGITESQKEAWGEFSGFVRTQAETMKSERQQRQAKWQKKTLSSAADPKTTDQAKKSPLDHMQQRITHMQERAERMQARLDAIKNLYAALTPEQLEKAKTLLGRHLM